MANPLEQAASGSSAVGTPAKPRSGVFKLLLEQHGETFAQVKRLGMRSEEQSRRELDSQARAERCSKRHEMSEVCEALRTVVETEISLQRDTNVSDIEDAMAALDATNPGSPEWGPTFLQLSELVEARISAGQDESPQLLAAG